VDISNWREHPHSQWAFQHARQLIPSAAIEGSGQPGLPSATGREFTRLIVDTESGGREFGELLSNSYTDGLLVLHNGKAIMEWSAEHFDARNPHIVFSVSKSITAILAGILEGAGIVDCEAPIVDYLPGVRDCVYGSARIRHLLDMTIALDFEENYTDKNSEYIQYRKATAWNPVNQNEPGHGLESFLYSLSKTEADHGSSFLYRSPNSDLLGLVLERTAGVPLASLFSNHLWKPMGAASDGYITVDRYGAPRAAGGICITLHDLALIGQLFLNNGMANGTQVVPAEWIEDTRHNGNQDAWDRGNYKQKLPDFRYRNKWYLANDADQTICARGIHGQLLYINPARNVVIARLSSHPDPLHDADTNAVMAAFDQMARECQ